MSPSPARAAAVAAVLGLASAGPAHADPLPPGSLGAFLGVASGTGADAKTLGLGYLVGGSATWQPMTTEQRLGWSAKLTAAFGTMSSASAARITDELLTLQMDLMVGIRLRPGANPSRYLTLRAGGALFRTNQVLPDRDDPTMSQRAFAGPIASIGLDQYISGWLFNVDVRYSMIGTGPTALGLVIGVAKTGP